MNPLVSIYMIRIGLGVISGVISAYIATFFNPADFVTFINCLTVALAIYLISFYIIKFKFYNRIEKRSKIMTMGIGIFFISWIVFLILTYTILAI